MSHFTQLREWLRQEKEADLQEFLKQVRQRSLTDRVAQGYTWYPLKVLNTGFALGDKAFVVVERTAQVDQPHQLRAGQSVRLFTNQPHTERAEATGVLNYVDRNRAKLILNTRDVPEWLSLGQLGVDMLFDDRTYTEMERAIQAVMEAKGNRLAELRDLSTGDKRVGERSYYVPLEDEQPANLTDNALNPSQARAVLQILENRDFAIIHGPPGTGKTTTLVEAIRLLCQRESTVLVAAPSNTAADLLTERLAAKALSVVRIGNISRVDDSVLMHTLEGILARHPESKNIKKVKQQAAEYRRQVARFKRTFTAEDRRERNHLRQQAGELEDWAIALENRLIDQILSSAQAIICTLVGAAHPVLERYKFRTCVIDEAAQALEPACWIPILKCSRVVLAGDPFQLPPTVKSNAAARSGLTITLLERGIAQLPDRVSLLMVQYRMHQAIMNFSNQYFYGGVLEAHASVGERRLLVLNPDDVVTVFDPVVFIDTAGCGFEEKVNQKSGDSRAMSRYNPDEALILREHLLQLAAAFEGKVLPSIGILSPYREQVNYLDEMLREDPVFAAMLRPPGQTEGFFPITVQTIDGFQGQERDVVYLSLVRSNAKHEIGFLQDYRRMNVAMTRARMLLVVIGDSSTIGNNKFYSEFLDYCQEKGEYQTAWAYMR
jgi:ATP-dependent RNA/DNA helicase IGHMBP2